ncbi:MAG: GNAT family N-acetyltransferase [Beijerinckiaceae bacterium]|nr:GNAT family N-acetyltransferase [Beijerinckiaceae bacterium]
MTLTVGILRGAERAAALDSLARLRIAVFRHYPYLYDGTVTDEAAYLADFFGSDDAVLVAARDGDAIVGAATASPMRDQGAEFRARFTDAGFDPEALFYFGESVLLADYRGRGIGHAFFDAREQAAREAGAGGAAFAAVIRAAGHPARPADYRPLDPFWRARGYVPVEGLTVTMDWKEVGEAAASTKALQVWMRQW